jgi:hypothetical protein
MDQPSRPLVDLAAPCACGAVRLAVAGTIRAMLLCACRDCQRATGTGHSVVALAAATDVTVTGPTKSFSRPAESGAILTRWFCPECGTPLHGESSRAPGLLLLPVGLFGDDTAWFAPSQVIFARSHRDWDPLPADLPRHATYRDAGSPR